MPSNSQNNLNLNPNSDNPRKRQLEERDNGEPAKKRLCTQKDKLSFFGRLKSPIEGELPIEIISHIFSFTKYEKLLMAQKLESIEEYKDFYKTVVQNFCEPLKEIINKNGNVNYPLQRGPYRGLYPLHVLAIIPYGNSLVSQFHLLPYQNDLLGKITDQINQPDYFGAVPLHYALQVGNLKMVDWLLKNRANVTIKSNYHNQLKLFIQNNDTILLLYEAGTALHYAAISGNEEIVNLLVKNNKNFICEFISQKTSMGYTPLHLACKAGNPKLVVMLTKLLITQKPSVLAEISSTPLNIDAKTKDNETIFEAMRLCIEENKLNVLNIMLQISWLKNYINNFNGAGLSSVHYAIFYKKPRILEKLLKAGANPNALSSTNVSPLKSAIYEYDYDSACMLLEHGAKAELPTEDEFLSHYYHQHKCDFEQQKPQLKSKYNNLIQKIKNEFINKNFVTQPSSHIYGPLGKTALHIACETGNEEMAEYILKLTKSKFVNARDNDNHTPLMLLAVFGYSNGGGSTISIKNLSNKIPEWKGILITLKENGCVEVIQHQESFNPDQDYFEYRRTQAFYEKSEQEYKKLGITLTMLEELKKTPADYIVSLLKHYGADFNLQDNYGRTALHYTFQMHNTMALPTLFKAGCDPAVGDFFYAAFEHNLDFLIKALNYFTIYKYDQNTQKTILHTAMENFINPHNEKATRKILKSLIYTEDNNSNSFSFRSIICNLELQYNTKPKDEEIKNKVLYLYLEDGNLTYAAKNLEGNIERKVITSYELGEHHQTILDILQDTLKNKKLNNVQRTALFDVTSKQGFLSKKYIFCQYDIDAEDENGETPIISAIKARNIVACEVLIANGANLVKYKNILGKLIGKLSEPKDKTLKELIENSLKNQDDRLIKLLEQAISDKDLVAIRDLIEKGAPLKKFDTLLMKLAEQLEEYSLCESIQLEIQRQTDSQYDNADYGDEPISDISDDDVNYGYRQYSP